MESPPNTDQAPAAETPTTRVLFTPTRYRRELWFDAALRNAALLGVFVAFFVLLGFGTGGSTAGVAAAVGIIVVWIAINGVGAAVVRALPGLTAALEHQPEPAEAALANLLAKRALPRWVRMMLYHRLATLRHRQQDFVASSAIAQTLLTTSRPGAAATHRAHLLLLLTEARLELRDPYGAWLALCALSTTPLSLTEALQRMALRTRFELLAGQHEQALWAIDQKLRLAELMPAPQCGALHAMLATAAERSGEAADHPTLRARVELLCGPQELEQLRENGWA